MLNRLSIRYKIGLIAFIGLLGFLILQSASYRLSINLRDQLQSMITKDFALLQFSNEVQVNFTKLNEMYQASLVEKDMDTLIEADHKAIEMKLRFESLQASLKIDNMYLEPLKNTFSQYVKKTSSHTAAVINQTVDDEQILLGYAEINSLRDEYIKIENQFLVEVYRNFKSHLLIIIEQGDFLVEFGLILGLLLSVILVLFSLFISRPLIQALSNAVNVAQQIAKGNLTQKIETLAEDETGQLIDSLTVMRDALKMQKDENLEREKKQNFLAGLNEVMRGDNYVDALAKIILHYLSVQLHGQIAVFYLLENSTLKMLANYAFPKEIDVKTSFQLGEGLVGQTAVEKRIRIINEVPSDYVKVTSATGSSYPRSILLFPVLFEGEVKALIEISSFIEFTTADENLVKLCNDAIAIALTSAQSRYAVSTMLEQTQAQAAELNQQRNEILEKNKELEKSGQELIEKSQALELSGKYKTQFLSTMSHELRTPLNSILILSEALMENRKGQLDDSAVEHATVINNAGADLLDLINDILDLSKVEEGKMEIIIDEITTKELANYIQQQFDFIAKGKGLEFKVSVADNIPELLYTDRHRLKQILKNFLSNALKFTDKGRITVDITKPDSSFMLEHAQFSDNNIVLFNVTDSGLGIDKNKQQLVFEAFKQADGTTSRKYGGTGLGLTISQALAKLLGGEIFLQSEGVGHGSTFTLALPIGSGVPMAINNLKNLQVNPAKINSLKILEENPVKSSKVIQLEKILIVEDNPVFHQLLMTVFTNNKMLPTIAVNGTEAMNLLKNESYDCLIVDLNLPDYHGLALLLEIRMLEKYQHVPIVVFTAEDLSGERQQEIKKYANLIVTKTPKSVVSLTEQVRELIFASKSLDRGAEKIIPYQFGLLKDRLVLITDDDERNIYSLSTLLEGEGIRVITARTGLEALELLNIYPEIDLVLLDIMMPEMDGYVVLDRIRKQPNLQNKAVITVTAKAMMGDKEKCLAAGATDYLSKPINANSLLTCILKHLPPENQSKTSSFNQATELLP